MESTPSQVLLRALPADFPAPVLVMQHRDPRYPQLLTRVLAEATPLAVRTAREHTRLGPETVWVAHADRQLLLGAGDTLVCERLEPGGRCTADRLFGSLAVRAGPRSIAVVLTGRLSAGAAAVCAVKGARRDRARPGSGDVRESRDAHGRRRHRMCRPCPAAVPHRRGARRADGAPAPPVPAGPRAGGPTAA